MIWEDLGAVSAYAIVKEKGYTGTEEEFVRMLINAEKIPELMEDVDYLKRNCTGGAGSSGGSGTGSNGKDGVGILEVKQTTTSTEDGGTNIVTVTKTNGEKAHSKLETVRKGQQGKHQISQLER